jgi:hypothetical protein
MSIFFKPTGLLDINTDPSELPETGDGVNLASGAMTRCKNLRLDQPGVAKTRDGGQKLNAAAVDGTIEYLAEQDGYRYSFMSSGHIYRNETIITAGAVCETPTFSPGDGRYTGTQSVTIATNTVGAVIYYTIDRTTPTAGTGLIYTSAVSAPLWTELQAIATKTNFANSAVATAFYYEEAASFIEEDATDTITVEGGADTLVTESD